MALKGLVGDSNSIAAFFNDVLRSTKLPKPLDVEQFVSTDEHFREQVTGANITRFQSHRFVHREKSFTLA